MSIDEDKGPVIWNTPWYSTKFEEIVDNFNKRMERFDGKERRIRLIKDLNLDGKFHGECTIEADSLDDLLLLFDELIDHVREESGEDYMFPNVMY